MSNKSKIEICANSVESAVKAQQAGAYRVQVFRKAEQPRLLAKSVWHANY